MKYQNKRLLRAIVLLLFTVCGFLAEAQPVLSVVDSTTGTCANSGVAKIYVSGGTAPYTYVVSGIYGTSYGPVSQTSNIFNSLPQGYFSVVITDNLGVTNAAYPHTFYINSSFYSYIYITPAVCPSNLGSESVNAYNGSGTYTYLWSTGATTSSLSSVPVGSHYTCTVTDGVSGCTSIAQDSGAMYQTSSIYGSMTSTPANCMNGTATVTPSGGSSPYTYVWSNGQTSATATGLSSGSPMVTITDALGCSAVAGAYISQAIVISTQVNATAEHCNDANGTLNVTALNGSAPFTYHWSSGQSTARITGLSGGSYSVEITDHNGCTAYAYGNVQKSTPIVLNTSNTATVCTSPTGTVSVTASGGTTPYSYVWNTSPPQTTASATALAAGTYVVNVVDAVGCTQNQSAAVHNNTTLALGLTKVDAHCGGSSGSVTAFPSGGSTPYTLLWNNGSTASTVSGITGAGSYSCVVTDNLGCKVGHYIYVESISPVGVSINPVDASCIYTADGSATMTAYGGLSPYNYHWPNASTTTTATGLGTGGYCAFATDANGCASYCSPFHIGYTSVTPCAVIISGSVIDDADANCAYTGVDAPLQGVWIGCSPGGGYKWTDGSGAYSFTLHPGTYTLAQAPPLYHTLVCPLTPSPITLAAGSSSTGNDFYDQPDTFIDVAINCIPYSPPVAGFTQHVRLCIRNLGNITENPNVVYMHSADLSFLSASPAPVSYSSTTGRLEWNGAALATGGISYIDVLFSVPSTLPLGHILNNSDTVYPIVGDTSVFNNFEDCQALVVGSYDPNYIDVMPKGTGTPGYIRGDKDTTLRYAVHFQNTGSYHATYVTLKIPIDANLDISTFSFVGASHAVTSIDADNNRMLTIRFDNINLPDSGSDRLGSQGFAAFTFRLKHGLAVSTQITEMANIYFDYNTPVPTGNAFNTIQASNGINEAIATADLKVYPNPAKGNVTLDMSGLNESKVLVTVYDMSGRAMISKDVDLNASKQVFINTSSLTSGVYVIEASGSAKYIQKLVKTQ